MQQHSNKKKQKILVVAALGWRLGCQERATFVDFIGESIGFSHKHANSIFGTIKCKFLVPTFGKMSLVPFYIAAYVCA